MPLEAANFAQLAELDFPASGNWRMRRNSSRDFTDRGYDVAAMKSLRFLPLTFLAGVHGFALFAPYAAFATAALLLFRRRRQPALQPIPMGISVIPRL